MALRYLIYRTDFGNTIVRENPTDNSTGGTEVALFSDFVIPEIQPLYLWRVSGGSRIYIQENGSYNLSYLLNVENQSNTAKIIGTIIRKNGVTDVTPLSSASYSRNVSNDASTNSMPQYKVNLINGDYIELLGFRIGSSGSVLTVPDGSWIKIEKII